MSCTSCKGELEADALFCGHCGRRTRRRHASLCGTVIDTYRVDERIAEGGFGAIYRATHLPTGATLALKVLHADFAGDPALAARFVRESMALARLQNPHTVVTYERGEARDGTLYIAMELLCGESLFARFRRCGPLPWRQMLAIMRAVCSSLGEAHHHGIVHRDLKPANIHLGIDDFVKVLDFGVAKVLPLSVLDDGSELTFAGQAVGTLEYMAPEQLAGAECDPRTDIYTLGVLAYEMIVGRRPFAEAVTPPSLITALFTQTVPVPSAINRTIPPMIDQLLLRCLEREPGDRFATVQELIAAIDRIVVARPSLPATGTRSAGALQTVEARRFALAPTLAYELPRKLRPSQMPAFDVAVRGTVMELQQLAVRERRWLMWVAWLAAGLVGVALACLV